MKIICSAVAVPLAALSIALTCGSAARAQPACDSSTVQDFSPQMAPAAKSFLASLKAAVRASDKDRIAAMVRYPLRVNTKRGHRSVRTRAEFLKDYDRIFNGAVRASVVSQSPDCLFANWQGVMIGGGGVWFQQQKNGAMRTETLNPPGL